jgi:ribosomal protein S14
MVKKIKNTWKQHYNRIEFTKSELRILLIKGVKTNKNIKTKYRALAYSKVILNQRKYKYKNYTQTCLISGKSRGVWSFSNLSRHKLTELSREGSLLNLKPVSW